MAGSLDIFAPTDSATRKPLKPVSLYGKTVGGVWLPVLVGSDGSMGGGGSSSDLAALIGEVAATPTLYTLLGRLRSLEDKLDNDSSLIIGDVGEGAPATDADPSGLSGKLRFLMRGVHNEDVASANADAGYGAMAVRQGTPANTSGTAGDYEFLQMFEGRLWVRSKDGHGGAVALTRTADSAPYLANDVVGAATGSTAALTFPIGPTNGGEVKVTSSTLLIESAAPISGETAYRLHLYNITPPSAFGDNVPWDLSTSGDRAAYLGPIDLGTPIDVGSSLYCFANAVEHQFTALGANVYAYMVTIGAHTPASGRVYNIGLHTADV